MPGKATVTERVNWGIDTHLRNQVQLSVYPDCIGPEGKRDIPAVAEYVSSSLGEAVGGVHMLPFYPSSADRGFAPLSHKEVNEDLGTWEDLQGIAKDRDLCVDYMVNHISAQSKESKTLSAREMTCDLFHVSSPLFKHCTSAPQNAACSILVGHHCNSTDACFNLSFMSTDRRQSSGSQSEESCLT